MELQRERCSSHWCHFPLRTLLQIGPGSEKSGHLCVEWGITVVISCFVRSLHSVPSFLSCLHIQLQLLRCHWKRWRRSYLKLRPLPLHRQKRTRPVSYRWCSICRSIRRSSRYHHPMLLNPWFRNEPKIVLNEYYQTFLGQVQLTRLGNKNSTSVSLHFIRQKRLVVMRTNRYWRLTLGLELLYILINLQEPTGYLLVWV